MYKLFEIILQEDGPCRTFILDAIVTDKRELMVISSSPWYFVIKKQTVRAAVSIWYTKHKTIEAQLDCDSCFCGCNQTFISLLDGHNFPSFWSLRKCFFTRRSVRAFWYWIGLPLSPILEPNPEAFWVFSHTIQLQKKNYQTIFNIWSSPLSNSLHPYSLVMGDTCFEFISLW